jgi:hypothetical protein
VSSKAATKNRGIRIDSFFIFTFLSSHEINGYDGDFIPQRATMMISRNNKFGK